MGGGARIHRGPADNRDALLHVWLISLVIESSAYSGIFIGRFIFVSMVLFL